MFRKLKEWRAKRADERWRKEYHRGWEYAKKEWDDNFSTQMRLESESYGNSDPFDRGMRDYIHTKTDERELGEL